MSLESCKWVQPFPRARERLAPQPLQYGPARAMVNLAGRGTLQPEKSRPRGMRPGSLLQERSISRRRRSRCAGACRGGFRPSAVAGSRSNRCRHRRRRSRRRWRDPSHGPNRGVMAVVKAAGGSGRCSGNGERGGGDQSEGHLAKHLKYSPVDWHEAVVSSLPISRTDDVLRSRASGRIVFQECFVARDRRTSLSSW